MTEKEFYKIKRVYVWSWTRNSYHRIAHRLGHDLVLNGWRHQMRKDGFIYLDDPQLDRKIECLKNFTQANEAFNQLFDLDAFPPEYPEVVKDAKQTLTYFKDAARYEFDDGSSVISGNCWGEQVICALGFTKEECEADAKKTFIPVHLWNEVNGTNYD